MFATVGFVAYLVDLEMALQVNAFARILACGRSTTIVDVINNPMV